MSGDNGKRKRKEKVKRPSLHAIRGPHQRTIPWATSLVPGPSNQSTIIPDIEDSCSQENIFNQSLENGNLLKR